MLSGMKASLDLPPRPTLAEELVHAVTHGVGALLAMVTLVILVGAVSTHGSRTAIGATLVFGASLVLLYVSSTVYHAMPARKARAKAVLQIVDHAAIHLLIAGTYTPFALCAVRGWVGWAIFGVVWSIATLGIVVETTSLRTRTRLSMGLYLGSGWLGLLLLPIAWSSLSAGALALLVLGGVAYTAGVPFFLADSRRWTHAMWHGFVLAGSALHVASIAIVVA